MLSSYVGSALTSFSLHFSLILSLFLCTHLLRLPFQHSHWHCFSDCSIIQDIKSYPLQCKNKGQKKINAFSFQYTPATTSQNSDAKTQEHKHSSVQTDGEEAQCWAWTHTQAHISHRQTNTQRDSKHKAQHSQKCILCRNILKCVLQYN